MRIALIGTPGSGKTDLAASIEAELLTRDKTVSVIDGYAPAFQTARNIAIGPMGDYIVNLSIALDRYHEERLAAQTDNDYVITCGTLIETAVYQAMQFAALNTIASEETRADLAPRVDATLRMFAVLYVDAFKYDTACYLPATRDEPDITYMDQQLQGGLAGFKLVPVTNLGREPEQYLSRALEAIDAVHVS